MRTENPRVVTISIALLYLSGLYAFGGCQQISQPIPRQNHPSVSNPARTSVLPPGYVVGATAVIVQSLFSPLGIPIRPSFR